ncbi:WxL domain-containing protein [Enterococcus faecalis]|uniref:WxL domain-containing protein n=1 Tax=Enterococcus faecalis TaxID=1351 RepID=UPI0035EFA784
MKKKLFASLLVGSAVVGASLAPLSAQAVTTGNTPVQVEFEGGTLQDQRDDTGPIVDPDPTQPNTNFDLLAIPKIFDFSPVKIGEDITAIRPISTAPKSIMVGDVRGTKEGWHVTGEVVGMSNGTDTLDGQITFGMTPYYAIFNESTSSYGGFNTLNGMNIANDPTAPSFNGASLKIGGGAAALINAPLGKGQGTWSGRLDNLTLNVTTPMQELKKGAYTGNVTWNLVAGPAI